MDLLSIFTNNWTKQILSLSYLCLINIVCYLFTKARIPVVTVNQSTYSEITGQSVTLQCTVSSPESILKSVLWIFDNGVSSKNITQSSNVTKYNGISTATPSLTIFNLSSTDIGTYTCTATNTVGTGKSNLIITLSVEGGK